MYRVKITDYEHFTGTTYYEYRYFQHKITTLLYMVFMKFWRGTAELEET